ncbi:hypothetical protein ACODTP_18710 [Acinetobacter pittii]|uniref:hypothetical protein n=1 Tax=Acinetobacter pittii TaxID=48296 RepID=UPI003B435E5D
MNKNPRIRGNTAVVEKQQKQTLSQEDKKDVDSINIGNVSEGTVSTENKPDEKPKSQFENGRITRNSTDIELLKNDLPSRSRNRKANGTNLTIPLYFEELIAIEEALEKENQADSLNDFIRELLLNKAKRVLGDKKYKELLSNELNKGRVVKIKKNKDK